MVITQQMVLPGDPTIEYPLYIRVRAITELMQYIGGQTFHPISLNGIPANRLHTVLSLTISDPAATVYMNSGPAVTAYSVFLDYYLLAFVKGGALMTLQIERGDETPLYYKDIGGGTVNADPTWRGEYVQLDFVNDLRQTVQERLGGNVRGWTFDGFNEFVLQPKAER